MLSQKSLLQKSCQGNDRREKDGLSYTILFFSLRIFEMFACLTDKLTCFSAGNSGWQYLNRGLYVLDCSCTLALVTCRLQHCYDQLVPSLDTILRIYHAELQRNHSVDLHTLRNII